jgi:hypothetical protein
MEIVGKDELDKVDLSEEDTKTPAEMPLMKESEVKAIVAKLDQPVEIQKDLAARLKLFLDKRMQEEMTKKGYLSDFTRRWVSEYNDLLDRIHKNLFGDKSVHLHLGKVTHAHIASLMRDYRDVPQSKETIVEVDTDEVQKETSSD